MTRRARRALKIKIMDKSINFYNFEKARLEWLGIQYRQDPTCSSQCQCGKKDIKRLWIIYNSQTNKTIKWIGNCCIDHFQIKLNCRRSPKNIVPKNNKKITDWLLKDQSTNLVNEDTVSLLH